MRAVILTKSAMKKHGKKGACTTALDLSCNRIVRFVCNIDGSPVPYQIAEKYSLLDIVEVKVHRQCPINPQAENVLVDCSSFRVVGHFEDGIEKILEMYSNNRNQAEILFMDNSLYALPSVNQFHHSLEIIRVSNLRFYVNIKSGGYKSEKASFTYNNIKHTNYSVTDPNYDIRQLDIKEKIVGDAIIIISIPTENYRGFGYFKFIAAVYPIEEKTAEKRFAEQNYYELLKVTEKSSIEDIKRAYKAFTRKYHPDISKDPNATEIMKRINLAYEVLSNPARREEYNRQLRTRKQGSDNNSGANNTAKKSSSEAEESARRRQAEEEKRRREEYARRAEEARKRERERREAEERERARRKAEEEYYRKQAELRAENERRAAEARKRKKEAEENERARRKAEEEQYREQAELKARKLREEIERRKRKKRIILIVLITSAIVFFYYKGNEQSNYNTPSTNKPINGTTYTNKNSSKPVSGTTDKKDPNRPVNGKIFTNKYAGGPIDLTVVNYSNNDYYVRLIDKYDIEAISFYIYGNSTINIKAPVGTYSVVYSTGKTWIDENKLFGDSTKTSVAKEKSSLPYIEPKQKIQLY